MISAVPPSFVKVLAYNLSRKLIVPELVVIASVVMRSELVVPTAPAKSIPPELVTVNVPISVPIAPLTVTAAVVLIVRFDLGPLATPLIDVNVIGVAAPAPKTSVIPSATVAAPNEILPVPELKVVLAIKLTGTLIDNGLLVAVTLAALIVTEEEVLLLRPPKKLNTSLS